MQKKVAIEVLKTFRFGDAKKSCYWSIKNIPAAKKQLHQKKPMTGNKKTETPKNLACSGKRPGSRKNIDSQQKKTAAQKKVALATPSRLKTSSSADAKVFKVGCGRNDWHWSSRSPRSKNRLLELATTCRFAISRRARSRRHSFCPHLSHGCLTVICLVWSSFLLSAIKTLVVGSVRPDLS